MLDVGVSSTHAILDFWGIDTAAERAAAPRPAEAPPPRPAAAASPAREPAPAQEPAHAKVGPAHAPAAEPAWARRAATGGTQGPVTRMPGAAGGPASLFGNAGSLLGDPGETIKRALRAAGLMGEAGEEHPRR